MGDTVLRKPVDCKRHRTQDSAMSNLAARDTTEKIFLGVLCYWPQLAVDPTSRVQVCTSTLKSRQVYSAAEILPHPRLVNCTEVHSKAPAGSFRCRESRQVADQALGSFGNTARSRPHSQRTNLTASAARTGRFSPFEGGRIRRATPHGSPLRNRWFVDSLLEQAGFELPVTPATVSL